MESIFHQKKKSSIYQIIIIYNCIEIKNSSIYDAISIQFIVT